MLPKNDDLFNQGNFIDDFLDEHFQLMNDAEIYYLCYLGNDDLRVFDGIFEEKCNQYPFIVNLAQSKFAIIDFEFVGMNWMVDYPFRLKDRCRMDTTDYKFQDQFGTGLFSSTEGWKEIRDWYAYARRLPTIEKVLSR